MSMVDKGQRNARARERRRLLKRRRERRGEWVLIAWQLGVGGAALVVGGALVSIVVLVGTLQGSVEWEYRKARKIDRATHDPHDFEDPR
ncbi:MAG: hypothetical protein FWD95_17655 [Nocardioidaceae bacterium]|nr:hypothetical protein [Nocardioidaceae bacterium]